jgi:hypothetical protein
VVEIRRGWRGETGCLKRRRHHHVRHCSELRRGARLLALFSPLPPFCGCGTQCLANEDVSSNCVERKWNGQSLQVRI